MYDYFLEPSYESLKIHAQPSGHYTPTKIRLLVQDPTSALSSNPIFHVQHCSSSVVSNASVTCASILASTILFLAFQAAMTPSTC